MLGDHHLDYEFACPACGVKQDGLAGMDTVFLPKDGDAIVCLYCESINVWEGDGLRHATENEALTFQFDPNIQGVLWAIRRTKERLGPPRGAR